MKKDIFRLFTLLLSLCLLSSCDGTKVTKTKEITDKITQTAVVEEEFATDNEEFSEFFKNFKKSFITPGLYEGIIPQGFCYDESTGYFLITGYYEKSKFPSMVMAVDSNTNKLVGAYSLKTIDGEDFFGHVGGIGTSQNTVYISSGNECFTFPLSLFDTVKNGDSIVFQGNFKVNTAASFLTIHDNILWIGDFVRSRDKEREAVEDVLTLESGETFYAFCEGYELENGLPSEKKINSENNGYIPDYFLAIPEQVQGIAFTKTDKIIFSTSYGRKNNSKLYIFEDVLVKEKAGTKTVDGKDVDLYACDSKSLIKEIIAPPMAEDLAIHPDGVYIQFESGAAKYRNGGGKYTLDTAYVTTIE